MDTILVYRILINYLQDTSDSPVPDLCWGSTTQNRYWKTAERYIPSELVLDKTILRNSHCFQNISIC
jgi:hypothetical protein